MKGILVSFGLSLSLIISKSLLALYISNYQNLQQSFSLFFLRIFFTWSIFKVFTEFVMILLPLSVFVFCFLGVLFGWKACGILDHPPGIEPTPPALEGEVLISGLPGRSLEWPHILKLNRESLLLFIKDCDYCIGPLMYKVQSWSSLEEVERMVTLEGWVVPEGDMSGLWKASHSLYIDLEAGKCVCSVCEKILKTPLTVWALFSLYWLPQKHF